MPSFNKVLLMGHLTRDPALKFLPSQMAVAEFGLACNRKFKTAAGEEREEVTFVDVTAFGKQAEVMNQYLQKGRAVFVEGRLKFDSWEKDGQKRSKLSVVVEGFQFLGGPREDDGGERQQRSQRREPGNKESLKGPPAEKPYGDEQTFKDDDIPFALPLA